MARRSARRVMTHFQRKPKIELDRTSDKKCRDFTLSIQARILGILVVIAAAALVLAVAETGVAVNPISIPNNLNDPHLPPSVQLLTYDGLVFPVVVARS